MKNRCARLQTTLSLRGAKRRGNPFSLWRYGVFAVYRGCGFPRPVTSVTGLGMTAGVFALPYLFPTGNYPKPATPQSTLRPPAPLIGAPRGCGTANAPVPNLCREALPLLGEVPSAHTGERGRQSQDTSRPEKTEQSKILPCYCEASSQTGRGNPYSLCRTKTSYCPKEKRIPTSRCSSE